VIWSSGGFAVPARFLNVCLIETPVTALKTVSSLLNEAL